MFNSHLEVENAGVKNHEMQIRWPITRMIKKTEGDEREDSFWVGVLPSFKGGLSKVRGEIWKVEHTYGEVFLSRRVVMLWGACSYGDVPWTGKKKKTTPEDFWGARKVPERRDGSMFLLVRYFGNDQNIHSKGGEKRLLSQGGSADIVD